MKTFLDRVLDSAERVIGQQMVPAAAPTPTEEIENSLLIDDPGEFRTQPVPEPAHERPVLIMREGPVENPPPSQLKTDPKPTIDEACQPREPRSVYSEATVRNPFESVRVEGDTGFPAHDPRPSLTQSWTEMPRASAMGPSLSGAWADTPSVSSALRNSPGPVRNRQNDVRSTALQHFVDSPVIRKETVTAAAPVGDETKSWSRPVQTTAPAAIVKPSAIVPPNTTASAPPERMEREPSPNNLIIQNLEIKVVTKAPDLPARPATRPAEAARQTPAGGAWVSSARRYAGRV